jgi:hypothetical protein
MGSPALTKTIGITNVTSFAARPEWAPPTATITGTCRAIRSDASDSNAHIGSPPSDISIPTCRPSTLPSTSRRLMKAAVPRSRPEKSLGSPFARRETPTKHPPPFRLANGKVPTSEFEHSSPSGCFRERFQRGSLATAPRSARRPDSHRDVTKLAVWWRILLSSVVRFKRFAICRPSYTLADRAPYS